VRPDLERLIARDGDQFQVRLDDVGAPRVRARRAAITARSALTRRRARHGVHLSSS